MNRKAIAALIAGIFLFSVSLLAVEDAAGIKTQLTQNLKLAGDLMKQADTAVVREKSVDKLKQLMAMYAHAGKLFQDTLQVYGKMGPDKVSQADVQHAKTSMEKCIAQIQGIKKRIESGAASPS